MANVSRLPGKSSSARAATASTMDSASLRSTSPMRIVISAQSTARLSRYTRLVSSFPSGLRRMRMASSRVIFEDYSGRFPPERAGAAWRGRPSIAPVSTSPARRRRRA